MAEKDAEFFRTTYRNKSAQSAADMFSVAFDQLRLYCESPIEEALLAGLLWYFEHERIFYPNRAAFIRPDWYSWPDAIELPPWRTRGVAIVQRGRIGDYRVDFLFVVRQENKTAWLAVECDGHDFHERTKEQAEHDRSRDRWMAINNIQIMRFTGREIWRDPESCAKEIDLMLEKISNRLFAEKPAGGIG